MCIRDRYIAHNVIKNLDDVDCAIIVWTSYPKIDLYIESQDIVDEIQTYESRNFVLNKVGRVVKNAPAWWPSSVSGGNRIKDWINKNIFSDTYQVDKTLIQIAGVQKALENKNIDYHMFLGYNLPLDKAGQYGINLERFVTLESMYDNYFSSDWQKNYSTTNEYGLVPVAGWHWQFYNEYIFKILDARFKRKDVDLEKITKGVQELTEKQFKDGVS